VAFFPEKYGEGLIRLASDICHGPYRPHVYQAHSDHPDNVVISPNDQFLAGPLMARVGAGLSLVFTLYTAQALEYFIP
jgi:hypothetical protein